MLHSQLLEGLKCESQTENSGRVGNWGTFFGSQHYRRVEGCAKVLGWDQEEVTNLNHSHGPAQNQHKVVSAQLEHFWCQEKPRATQTHKTHHKPNLGEANTFPFIVYFALLHGATSKWFFIPGLPSGSPEIPTSQTPTTLKAHNFLCRPLIIMRSEAKLQPLSKAFQQYVACCLNARKLGQFLTFSGQESNWQFDSQPFFWP